MKRTRSAITTVLCLVFLAVTALAQRPMGPMGPPPGGGPGGPGQGRPGGPGRPPGDHPPRPGMDEPRGQHQPPPMGPQAGFLSSEMRFGDRVVKGSPYSAQFSTENIQTLADGTRITRKSQGAVYRSTEGHTRREQALGALGPVPMEGEPRQLVFINDPVAGAHYVLDVQDRSARKLPFRDSPPPNAGPPPDFPGSPDPVITESLGKQMIEGVEAEGTRSTITIPAGRIGNDRALKIVSERWYSPDLKIVVLSKHSDPFAGENIYRLINISRQEPPMSLFTVPTEYRIMEERGPAGPGNPRE